MFILFYFVSWNKGRWCLFTEQVFSGLQFLSLERKRSQDLYLMYLKWLYTVMFIYYELYLFIVNYHLLLWFDFKVSKNCNQIQIIKKDSSSWSSPFQLLLATFSSESQSEISIAEQDLRKAREAKQDIEKKMKLIEEEKSSLERELQDLRDKYKSQARELKDAVAKQKIAIEQYTDSNDAWVWGFCDIQC